MISALGQARPQPAEAGSVILRTFISGIDEDRLFSAFSEAFAEHGGHEQTTPESWWFDLRDSADAGFDPSLWHLAFEGDQLVGFCLTKVREDDECRHGYVSQLGVRPSWRGNGLG